MPSFAFTRGPAVLPAPSRAAPVARAVAMRPGWARVVRLAATGLAAGAAAGFLGALLRPRRWIEYAQPQLAPRR